MEGINHHEQPNELAEQVHRDELAIRSSIEAARAEEREVDDATARAIAEQLHGGQHPALHGLASTGNLADERLQDELRVLYQDPNPLVLEWASVLGTYALHREHLGPVEGSSELRPTEQTTSADIASDEAQARADLFNRISAAGVTTLGQVATIYTVEGRYGRDERVIDDIFWQDAARWRPELVDEWDGLGADGPDAAFGTTASMGRGALVHHRDRPGGVVYYENQYGRRWSWSTDSDSALTDRWKQDRREYLAFNTATSPANSTRGGVSPGVWVGSLADYTAGLLHGEWFDATVDAEVLQDAVQFMLRNSHEPNAEEYSVMDYDGFGSDLTRLLGAYPSLATLSKLAQGIAEHGRAYAEWAAYVGPSNEEAIDRFEDYYLGEWDSLQAYAENLLEESEAFRYIEAAAEWLLPYLTIDVESYARDLGSELHTADTPDGKVWVFNANC